jgi:hypothetical protein
VKASSIRTILRPMPGGQARARSKVALVIKIAFSRASSSMGWNNNEVWSFGTEPRLQYHLLMAASSLAHADFLSIGARLPGRHDGV